MKLLQKYFKGNHFCAKDVFDLFEIAAACLEED